MYRDTATAKPNYRTANPTLQLLKTLPFLYLETETKRALSGAQSLPE